jgi:hypothetical protein
VGSLSPTRDECGRTFAPGAPKRDFQVSKEGGTLHGQKEKGCKEGAGKIGSKALFMKCDVYVSLLVCICGNKCFV